MLLWKGAISDTGYGSFAADGQRAGTAHRFSYETFRGEIADGMTLDHLCRVRRCVNPWHLEVVTYRENVLRGTGPGALSMRRTTCLHGHVRTAATIVIRKGHRGRECRVCINEQQNARYAAKRAERSIP